MIKQAAVSLAVLALGACASSPTAQFATDVSAAQRAGQPLVIYDLETNGSIDSKLAMGFINTTDREISTVTLRVIAYNQSHPVWGPDGKAISATLTAVGDFLPGSSYAEMTPHALWTANSGGIIKCAMLTDIEIGFKDGSSMHVQGDEAREYLTPQNNSRCGARRTVSGGYADVAAR